MWLVGVFVRRYIHFLILLIPTPLVSALFGSSIRKCFSFFDIINYGTMICMILLIMVL